MSIKLSSPARRPGHKRGASEVSKFLQLLKPDKHRKSKSEELDAEALTAEESLSRKLHKPSKLKHKRDGPMFEHFIVVGVDNYKSNTPKIVFKYPSDTDTKFTGLEEFCFPNGIDTKELPVSTCKSELLEIAHNKKYLNPEFSFVFLITDENKNVYFGICVHKLELLSDPPNFVPPVPCPSNYYATTMRCYCLISKFPFVRTHFEFIFNIFAMDHVLRLESQLPTIEHESAISFSFTQSSSSIPTASSPPDSIFVHGSNSAPLDYNFLSSSSPSIPTPKSSNDRKRGWEWSEDENECINAIEKYYNSNIPSRGTEFIFSLSSYVNEIKFSRPYLQEESELAAEWSYPTTFKNIPFTIIIQLLSAILLEKKILIISSNLRYLSSFILSIKPLIRPYVYQSIITPIIPLKMVHLLEAPVPFVVGMTTLPSRDLIPSDVIVFDLLNNQFRTPYQIPLLPNAAILKCEVYLKELKSCCGNISPFEYPPDLKEVIYNISTVFETHLGAIFANFENYTICNMSDPSRPISVFIKESFVEDIPETLCDFIVPFLETQIFFQFSDRKLRKRDKVHIVY